MPRLGLALSGGGFRATLFHLGVVRFLHDAGVLKDVSHIVSVSGGSILAGHLALNWDKYTGSSAEFDEIASRITDFVQWDVRNRIVRRIPMLLPFRLLSRLAFLGYSRQITPNGLLERYYDQHLYGNKTVHDLPEHPELHLLTTNVSEGCLCSFNREGLFKQQRGKDVDELTQLPARLAKVSLAVAASSAFPGFFPPVRIAAGEIGLQEGEFPDQAFTDGGVYDNLGVRAFDYLNDLDPPLDEIIVSDAGQLFRIQPKRPIGMIGQALRASDILMDRVWQLEKDNFEGDPRFLFIPTTDLVDSKDDPSALDPLVQPEVQNIRTDLDHFTELEIRALVEHGYCVARQRCRSKPELFGGDLPTSSPWNPLASSDEGASESNGSLGAASAPAAARQIRQSANRRIWSSLLDFRDWTTFFYIPVLVLMVVVLPYQLYGAYRRARTNQLVIDAIKTGDPEFHKILELVAQSPTVDFTKVQVKQTPQPLPVDYSKIEMLETTRIIDLRRWTPEAPGVYSYSRSRLRKSADYQGDNKLRFNFPVPQAQDYSVKLGPEPLAPVLIQTEQQVVRQDLFAGKSQIWQLEFDLSTVPTEQPIQLTMESQFKLPAYEGTTSYMFGMPCDTAVTNVWILFPEDRPYRKYQLLRRRSEQDGAQQVVEPRFNIDHPYGFIIGWSMINAKQGEIYTCEWDWEE